MAKVFGASAIRICTIFLIIYNFNYLAASENQKNELYDINSELPRIGSYASIIKLREKRQTSTEIKSQYSINENPSKEKQLPPQDVQVNNGQFTEHPSVLVPMTSPSNRPLLGVNGTGQRKDKTDKQTTKATVVPEAIEPSSPNDANVTKKPNQYPKKALLGATQAAGIGTSTQTADEISVDNIDLPENDTLNVIKQHNFSTVMDDHHIYYNSSFYVNKEDADRIWKEIKNITHNSMLSQSHRRAMTVELTFDFPFYGHLIRNITVATGGFLYTGEYVHSWLAATQYIAPLMANFDTSLGNDSYVKLNDNGTALTVIWENVSLQDKQDVGKFTFSTTLHKNGDIVFAYFNVPIMIPNIQDDKHPVKVGLSDAYIIDKVVYFARRKTIYEYHRVTFSNADIRNSTIIYLTALPTCLGYTDCVSCINHATNFQCAWCPSLNRCSTGMDRRKQEWLSKGCDRTQISKEAAQCPPIGTKGNNSNQTNGSESTSTNYSYNNNNKSNNENHSDSVHPGHSNESGDNGPNSSVDIKPVNKETKSALNDHAEPKSMGLAVGFLVPICLVAAAFLWVLYAYRNPHTKSGQLLIQYRPSQWSWRRGEARYTAATIHM